MSFSASQYSAPVYAYDVVGPTTCRAAWHPKVRAFYEYWSSLGTPGCLPGRQHLEPTDIPHLLPHLWIRDVFRDPLRFRARLMGTAIVEALGVDLTGKWLDEADSLTASYEAVDARLKRSVLEQTATYGRATLLMNVTKKRLMIETVAVPLARDGKTVDMLMGCAIMEVLTARSRPPETWEPRQR